MRLDNFGFSVCAQQFLTIHIYLPHKTPIILYATYINRKHYRLHQIVIKLFVLRYQNYNNLIEFFFVVDFSFSKKSNNYCLPRQGL